jgi:hypothetical protein
VTAARSRPATRRPDLLRVAAPGQSTRAQRGIGYALLAAITSVPVMMASPGRVVADTKQYLYLDPGRVLARAWSMWDPNIGMGTVTHQNIGYLFPMGPWYWTADRFGVPDWVAQRIWLASILFAAGLGVLFLFRTIGLRGSGAVVGALLYTLSPYWLEYAARLSVLLLPWAGLPWMVALLIRALRRGGWRHAALFALLVQVIGSVNATALVFAGVGPLLWIPYALFVDREVGAKRVLTTAGKIGLLTVLASAWWISGLWAQGSYGLDILKYTETLRVVSRTTLPNEVLRGLGYWFFYGRDRLGPWIEASTAYTQRPAIILVSYAVPALALLSAAVVRWRHRVYFAALVVVGVVIAVGAHPYDSPTPVGAAFEALSRGSTVAFALRSTGRAVPLVILGFAGLLAAGTTAAVDMLRARGRPRVAIVLPVLAGVLLFLNLPALWTGAFYGTNLQRPEALPRYWQDAAKYLDDQGDSTRVLELPGSDFGSYRWGQTVDPITPGIIDRPYVARELIPYGSPASADLLNAFDLRLQDRELDPQAIAPLMRLMGVGDVTLRNDIEFERYRLLRPLFTWDLFTPTPPGLDAPKTFGTPASTQSGQSAVVDAQALLADPNLAVPPPVAVFGVRHPSKIVRTAAADRPMVMAGDGDGMVDASEAGLLAGQPLVLYSASYGNDPAALRAAIGRNATLVVTDSNRDRARRWSTLTETAGYTEGPGTHPLVTDESDARLDLFPDQRADAQTETILEGATSVAASDYGNAITYTPEDRPTRAFDGDIHTAWRTGEFDDVKGDRIRIVLDHPITTDHVDLVQVLDPPNDRFITRARIRFDGGHERSVDLGPESRTVAGQTVTFPTRRFRSFEVEVQDTNVGDTQLVGGLSAVGFAEIRLQDGVANSSPVVVHEVVRMPGDLLRVAGRASRARPLVVLMNRDRVQPQPARSDPETALVRRITLPTARRFALAGQLRLSRDRSDSQIDRTLGYAGPVVAESSARLVDAPAVRASAALDHDPSTAWETPFRGAAGAWLDVAPGRTQTIDHLDLDLVADGRHSVPSEITVANHAGESRTVALDVPAGTTTPDATVHTTATFPALRGDDFRVTITKVRPTLTRDDDCGCDVETPAAIAELGVPGLGAVRPPADLPATCRDDLLTVDGKPVPVRLVGSTASATSLAPVAIGPCSDLPGARLTVAMSRGRHDVASAPGGVSGLDVDRLVWASAGGGAADARLGPTGTLPVRAGGAGPSVRVVRDDRASTSVEVGPASRPSWLVLGQSQNAGWTASIGGRSLGGSQLVDGYANGWMIPAHHGPVTVDLEWTPQRTVQRSIAVSIVAVVLCLGIVLVSSRRRRAEAAAAAVPYVAGGDAWPSMSWRAPDAVRRGWGVALLTGVLVGTLGALVVRPEIGIVLGALVVLVVLVPRLRTWFALLSPAFVVLAGSYIAYRQARSHLPPIFEWPTFFVRARTLGWLAVVVLAADVAVELATRHRRRPRGSGLDGRSGV